ncbi:MAG: ATP synthase F0 subunit B [candidate division Zixibacteria bacterium CG_4_9_14_3_um_filter_46_8]|nr:MAG: ATP synthase F0 subunit B [candidate division Zixibacteria bacterium CG_4_9_14_3_um_filter_46_8]
MESIASSLGLELEQLVTHALGFLIAVWLLKKFAWKPLLGLLDERRMKIKEEFDSIEAHKQENAQLLSRYEQKLKDIDTEARKRLQEAVAEGQKIASEIREQAKEDQKREVAKARQKIQAEIAAARTQLRDDMVNMAIEAASMAVAETIDDNRHRKLISDFIGNLENVK